MKKKLLSIALILILLIASLATVVNATATLITGVKVSNVKAPKAGENWMNGYIPTLPTPNNYEFDTSWYGGYTWIDRTAGNTTLMVGDTFIAGHEYSLYVYLKTTNTNYEFNWHSSSSTYGVGIDTAALNGMTISKFVPHEEDHKYCMGIEYEFGPCNVISDITAMVNAPVMGENPSYYVGKQGMISTYTELDDDSTIIDGVSWYDVTAKKTLKSTDKFYCTHAYRAYLRFIPYSNYVFASSDAVTPNVNATINGSAATATKLESIQAHAGVKIYIDFPAASGSHGEMVWVTTKEPTCTEKGSKIWACSVCGMQQGGSSIDALGHKYVKSTIKATLTTDGKIGNKCSDCGDIESSYTTIFHPQTFKLSKTTYTYNGKVQKPTITIKDSEGYKINPSNYTVTYSNKNSKKVGEYKVTIKFKGSYYEGTKTLTYQIAPKGTSISKLKAAKKKFTASWKKQTTETTGYEVQYSTNKNFKSGNKTVNISKSKTTSKAISKLKAKKKYYVRIRTYKKVNGKKIYSSWSKAKNITTKK